MIKKLIQVGGVNNWGTRRCQIKLLKGIKIRNSLRYKYTLLVNQVQVGVIKNSFLKFFCRLYWIQYYLIHIVSPIKNVWKVGLLGENLFKPTKPNFLTYDSIDANNCIFILLVRIRFIIAISDEYKLLIWSTFCYIISKLSRYICIFSNFYL